MNDETLYTLFISKNEDMSDELIRSMNQYQAIMAKVTIIDVIAAFQLGELPPHVQSVPIFEIETPNERYIFDTCEDVIAWCESNIDRFAGEGDEEKSYSAATVRKPG